MTNDTGLVYIGKIIDLQPIPTADFIVSATVVCGPGGQWHGVVRKADFEINDHCVVFLPDAQLNADDHCNMPFMKDSAWRVKMRRFKGAPSEVVIMQCKYGKLGYDSSNVGTDVTKQFHVTKYHKPVAPNLIGIAIGGIPGFIPKTDELYYQMHPELVANLVGKPYYITEKADGSSTTAFRYRGKFGVCSRNLELERNPDNGYWKIAIRYGLEEKLPEGIALRWETVGPGIQQNPMGWHDLQGLAFGAYNIPEARHLTMQEFFDLCAMLDFPPVMVLEKGEFFPSYNVASLGEGFYDNGKPREGVVVRSQENIGHEPISFKVINLNYET